MGFTEIVHINFKHWNRLYN